MRIHIVEVIDGETKERNVNAKTYLELKKKYSKLARKELNKGNEVVVYEMADYGITGKCLQEARLELRIMTRLEYEALERPIGIRINSVKRQYGN